MCEESTCYVCQDRTGNQTAFKWFTKASAQGNSGAMFNLGLHYAEGHGCDQDYTTAFKWYTKASAQGHSAAMFCLGNCYDNGYPCDQNDEKAFEWYEKSAQLGDKYAQDNLNGIDESHTSKRRKTEASDSDDELL